jgi:hypothetical protein
MVDLPALSIRARVSIGVALYPRPASVFPEKPRIHAGYDGTLIPYRLNRRGIEPGPGPASAYKTKQ